MSATPISIENTVENALVSLAESDSFTRVNGVFVQRWRTCSNPVQPKSLVCHVEPKEPTARDGQGRAIAWKLHVVLYEWVRVDIDTAFSQPFEDWMNGFTEAIYADFSALQSGCAGLKIYAAMPQKGDDTAYGEDYHGHTYKFDLLISLTT